jgi:hypothetical protein
LVESQIHKMCTSPLPHNFLFKKKINIKNSENAMKFNASNIKIKFKNIFFISLEIIYVSMDLI